ncbi:Alpha/beta hydrolase domain-containing protein 17C, partial [Fragariocoptes setiger]
TTMTDPRARMEELNSMILRFRVSELHTLLTWANISRTGKKPELVARAQELVQTRYNVQLESKIRELYHQARPGFIPTSNALHRNPSAGLNPPTPYHHNPRHQYHTVTGHMNYNSYLPSSSATCLPPTVQTRIDQTAPVRLKILPFYDILDHLVRPAGLISANRSDMSVNHSSLSFKLSVEQADSIAMSQTSPNVFAKQILLRFCNYDVHSEQNDNFPPSISVKVNDKNVQLPPMPNNPNKPPEELKRPATPLDITPLSKISPYHDNFVVVTWTTNRDTMNAYVVNITLSEKLNSEILLSRLVGKGLRDPEATKAIVREKLASDNDSDIATDVMRGSLICPLGKIRMRKPCRSNTCRHIQCFDALVYLSMNERKPSWVCPICDKPALYQDLMIDGLLTEILKNTPEDTTEVDFYQNGSYGLVSKKDESSKRSALSPPKKRACVQLDEDDEEVDTKPNIAQTPFPDIIRPERAEIEIVTISDSSGDDETDNDENEEARDETPSSPASSCHTICSLYTIPDLPELSPETIESNVGEFSSLTLPTQAGLQAPAQSCVHASQQAAAARSTTNEHTMTFSDLFGLLCCPPCPSSIASKLAFSPPELTYSFEAITYKKPSTDADIDKSNEATVSPSSSSKMNSIASTTALKSASTNLANADDSAERKISIQEQSPLVRVFKLKLNQRAEWQFSKRDLDNVEVFFAHGGRNKRIACMYVRATQNPEYTILYSHGNAADLGHMSSFYLGLGIKINCNIFGYDYSGYGISTGKPSEKNLYSDIEIAWKELRRRYNVSADRVILYGQSIGTVPTADLASKVDFAGVILHSPLTSGLRIAFPNTRRTWFFDAFPNIDKIPKINSPVLVIHGTEDEVIDISHGRSIHSLCKKPVEPLWVEGAGHNDVELFREFLERLKRFINVDLKQRSH